MTMMMMIMIH